jgi:putative hydrolase of the HAD superfamily
MPIEFIYFDLGNVLACFDHDRMCRQMADVACIDAALVHELLFDEHLLHDYEIGGLDDGAFYERFCQLTQTRPDRDQLELAASEIFSLNVSIVPIVAHLRAAGYRLGILSNTGPAHWRYCSSGRYRQIRNDFEVHALSYEIGSAKPQSTIFEAAARIAKVPPENILFIDDIKGHVAGAQAVGFDALHYTSSKRLLDDLLARGIRINL